MLASALIVGLAGSAGSEQPLAARSLARRFKLERAREPTTRSIANKTLFVLRPLDDDYSNVSAISSAAPFRLLQATLAPLDELSSNADIERAHRCSSRPG